MRADQIRKIKADALVYGHTTDAVLQAIPATATVLFGPSVRADQMGKLSA